MTHHIRVGVLRGGPSNEYEVSLRTGAGVLSALRDHHAALYHPRDIFIDREGNWHMDGLALAPQDIISKVDVVFNALHGIYGEDGKAQQLLESLQIPFTGSGSLASAMSMNKIVSKQLFAANGIKTPRGKSVSADDISAELDQIIAELFETCILPVVVKPAASGSSIGVSIVRSYDQFPPALTEAARHGDQVIIEEFIKGMEATCGVVEHFRGQDLYALPPVEIRPHTEFFDYEGKYGKAEEIVPATFPDDIKRELEELARNVHRLLGLRHYSRTDFRIHPRRGIYVLEANALPGLTDGSLLPKSLQAVGSGFHDLVGHLLTLAHPRR